MRRPAPALPRRTLLALALPAASAHAQPVPAPYPAVVAALARYDRTRVWTDLQDAADKAAAQDGAVRAGPGGAELARARVAGWTAVLSRFERDMDPSFDWDDRPFLNLAPRNEQGRPTRYPSGISPRDVEEPDLRRRYEADLAANSRRTDAYNRMQRLRNLHDTTIERASDSLRDAAAHLGLTGAGAADLLEGADLTDSDRAALLAAVR